MHVYCFYVKLLIHTGRIHKSKFGGRATPPLLPSPPNTPLNTPLEIKYSTCNKV